MAKWFSCCGGHGRHLGGCSAQAASKGSGLLRNRVPGNTQARLLGNLKDGRQPARSAIKDTRESLDSMVRRGWVEKSTDGTYKITDAGKAAYDLWEES